MKRYALFSWRPYEASGGWNDFQEFHETVDAAKVVAAADTYCTKWQIVDLTTGKIVGEDE